MKRDLKLNMSELRMVYRKIQEVWEALGEIAYASERFREVLRNQESLAYEELTWIWEKKIKEPEKALSGKLETLSEIVLSYINDMTAYVEPQDEGRMMRVDRNDIYHNYVQIYMESIDSFQQDLPLMQLRESIRDYKRTYIPDPFSSAAENESRKAALEEAEKEEREKRERNYQKLEEFRDRIYSESLEKLKECVDGIGKVYRDHIVPFENTDDAYKKQLSSCYDDWATSVERMEDIGDGLWDVWSGIRDAAVDLVKGIGGMLKGAGEIILWVGASALEPFGVELSDEIEDDVEQIFETGKAILSDPVNALGAVGQNICDVVDEKGIAYSVSYVATDVLIEIALEKGIGKIKELKNAKHVNRVDDVADAAGDLTRVESRGTNRAGDVLDEVMDGGSDIIELSNSNIQHIKKHTFDGMAEQANYLTDEQLMNKLNNTSFFNKNWSQDEIIKYTQEAYNTLHSQGKIGLQSIEINGEIIYVFIKEDGTFDTAYGAYKYTIDDFSLQIKSQGYIDEH